MTEPKQSSESDKKETSPEGATEREAQASSSSQDTSTDPASAESSPEGQDKSGDPGTKAEDYYNRLVRTMADFDNFKKRAARERMETARYACSALLEKLLPVLDNLEMAMSATEKAQEPSVDSLKTGVGMVLQQFKAALKEAGMEEIEASGKPFDPNLHEAVSQQETDAVPEGHISVQLRRGYKLYDRLLRPASVVVAKAPAQDPNAESADSDQPAT